MHCRTFRQGQAKHRLQTYKSRRVASAFNAFNMLPQNIRARSSFAVCSKSLLRSNRKKRNCFVRPKRSFRRTRNYPLRKTPECLTNPHCLTKRLRLRLRSRFPKHLQSHQVRLLLRHPTRNRSRCCHPL